MRNSSRGRIRPIGLCSMEELVRSQKYDELAEYCEEEELKVRTTYCQSVTRIKPGDVWIL